MFDASKHTALVLNADFQPLSYFPLSTWSFDRTMRNTIKDRVTVLEEYDTILRSQKWEYRPPSVVALKNYVKKSQTVPFTRFNVFLRDRFTCQYCKEVHSAKNLTFDHVIPRVKGGQTTWENIVSACYKCNLSKASKLIKPIKMPKKPTAYELLDAQKQFRPPYLHESWAQYTPDFMYWNVPLEP